MEQSLVQRLSGLSSLHHSRHPFLSLQRPGAGPPSHQDKQDLIRVSESKDDNDEDDDPGDDDDEKRKKKKTRTVFSRSQVSVRAVLYFVVLTIFHFSLLSPPGVPVGVNL